MKLRELLEITGNQHLLEKGIPACQMPGVAGKFVDDTNCEVMASALTKPGFTQDCKTTIRSKLKQCPTPTDSRPTQNKYARASEEDAAKAAAAKKKCGTMDKLTGKC